MNYKMFEANAITRCVPDQFPELKWQEFARKEQVVHTIVSICEEIVDVAANEIYEHYLRRKSFEFINRCLRTIWLRVFNASINTWMKLLNKNLLVDLLKPSYNTINLFVSFRSGWNFIQK